MISRIDIGCLVLQKLASVGPSLTPYWSMEFPVNNNSGSRFLDRFGGLYLGEFASKCGLNRHRLRRGIFGPRSGAKSTR